MRYKGIIFDIDGTAVPLGGLTASKRLRGAVQAASKDGLKLAAATGRSFSYALPTFSSLGLKDPSIMMNGSVIIHPLNHEIIWSKSIDGVYIQPLQKILNEYRATVRFGISPLKIPVPNPGKEKPVFIIWVDNMQPQDALNLLEAVSTIPGVVAHNTPSWNPGLIDSHITHEKATKGHAVEILIKKLGLRPEEVIGVGDSSNDIPLFDSVGFKIAMDNATDDLKALADEIAPSVDEDGLAQIIEKYTS